jgi:hypothetical protein
LAHCTLKVRQLTQEIKDIAESAQADVGYDYIWLDDVTYLDWQRYHDLADSAFSLTSAHIFLLLNHTSFRVGQLYVPGNLDSEWHSPFTPY